MPEPQNLRAQRMGQFAAPRPQGPPWQPNWIDYRASVARSLRREGAGEQVPLCDLCGCEADLDPVPHSPRCPSVQRPARRKAGPKAKAKAKP